MVRLNPLYVFGAQGEAERVSRGLRGCAGGVLATVFPRRGQLQDIVDDGRARRATRDVSGLQRQFPAPGQLKQAPSFLCRFLTT